MISGSHVVLYSRNADADRAFFRDVLKLGHVDVGRGWLIFGLPPSEVAVHPTEGAESHEFYLMCDDIEAFIKGMTACALRCTPIHDERWGRVTELTLPGGGKLGVYEPRHPRPTAASGAKKPRRRTATAPKKARKPAPRRSRASR
jgi:hypothetical protein